MTLQQKNNILKNLYLLKQTGYKYIKPLETNLYTTIQTQQNLEQIENEIQNCHLCNLAKLNNKTNNKIKNNEKILFIDTYKIDNLEQSNIFNEFKNILNLQTINILPILKCYTSNNNEIQSYINSCKSYILKQLKILQPQIIITLGDSYNYLTKDNSDLTNLIGENITFQNYKIIPFYHPRYLQRNPSFYNKAILIIQKIKQLMEKK